MTLRPLALALAAVTLAACTPKLIPGTGVRDSSENRAVVEVLRAYVEAMQRRDAAGVLALVAPDYFDKAGTPDPADDLDRAGLEKALTSDLARVEGVRLELSVRKVEARDGQATAEVLYDGYYRVTTPGGPVAKRESDLHLMRLRQVDGAWKFVSGL
jgi:ketosteroid isomerase-like protein